MPDNNIEKKHVIAAPDDNITMEEAYDYIDDGLNYIKENNGDADAVTGWLDYCCQVFRDKPYGRKVVLDCLDIKIAIMKQKAAFETLAKEKERALVREQAEELDIDKLVEQATHAAKNSENVRARALIDVGLAKALDVREQWDDAEPLMCNFDNPVEFLAYANITKEDGGEDFAWAVPNIANVYYVDAILKYEEGLYEQAAASLDNMLLYNPVSCGAWLEMCECYKQLGDVDAAEKSALKARELAWRLSDISKAHRSLAWVCGERGEFELAASHLVLAQDYEPTEMGKSELSWIATQGFDPELVTLESALDKVGCEGAGECPAVPEVAAAVLAAGLEYANADEEEEFGEDVILNLMLWDRTKRARFHAGEPIESLLDEN